MGDKIDSDRSVSDARSESKSMVGNKRNAADLGEQSEVGATRVKMRDLDTVFRAEGKVYVTDENCLQRYKILIAKCRELRASGFKGLKGCIKCLSDVIDMMNDMNGGEVRQSVTICHQLAVAYSLRALCNQEDEPNSKHPFEDIQAALNLWSRPDFCLVVNENDIAFIDMPSLLYQIIDMLAMKGCTKFHHDLYELLIRLSEKNDVPLDKCLALLWKYRRLGHALCASPVSEEFITTFSQHHGEISRSMDFWRSSLSGSLPLEVGFQQSFSFILSNFSHGSCKTDYHFRLDIKVDEVKKAVLHLTSKDRTCTSSNFLAAHLYHDLCGRLVSNGRIVEALSYAKKARQIRMELLKENFIFSTKKTSEISDENGAISQRYRYRLSSFHMRSTVATAFWDPGNTSSERESCLLTPWKVLQCYLESVLQVGIVSELIGDGSEAETQLLWGRCISSFLELPLFKVAFSSVLGILYRKMQLWDLAEEELHSAKQILADCCGAISCIKCRLLFEATIDLHLGDLVLCRHVKYPTEILSERPETFYESALDKLNLSEWKNSVSSPEEIVFKNVTVCDAVGMNHSDVDELPSPVDKLEMRIEAKKTRKTRKALKQLQEQCSVAEQNSRMTRSRYHSQKNDDNIPCDIKVGSSKYSKNRHRFAFPDKLSQGNPLSKIESPADSGCDWYCLSIEIMKPGCINNLVHMNWELARRRVLLKLLIGKGKCLGVRGEIHEAHNFFLQSISVLVSRNLFSAKPPVSSVVQLDMIGKEIPGDPLAVERATVLYNISWFTLKSYPCKGTRMNSSTGACIPRIISWMMLSFVLCREVPVLFQKVSRLLAAIFVLSSSIEIFSSYDSPCKALSKSHWASYFHQASLGTHFNLKLLFTLTGDQTVQDQVDVEGLCRPGSSSVATETLNLLRLAPASPKDLAEYVLNFFRSLPCTSIVGLSVLGGGFASLLSELLGYPSQAPAWILLSRLQSDCQPIVLLRPVDSVLEDDGYIRPGSGIHFEAKSLAVPWHCPWGSSVVDYLAPEFKRMLEENKLSDSKLYFEEGNQLLWWEHRSKLNRQLMFFLRKLEDLWFGPWKIFFSGELSGCKQQESVLQKLVQNLKVKCNVDAEEGLLKVFLGGAKHARESEQCILQLILGKGCFIGDYKGERRKALLDACPKVKSKVVFKLMLEASKEIEKCDCLNREPVILVLDFDVQMLPWENLPIMRNQEVYRMPSVGSIFATLHRCGQFQEHDRKNADIFPLIDPLDGYYSLNPGGNLKKSQHILEDFFKEKNLEGMAGSAPIAKDLALALESHDLFIYCGHGSGTQIIPEQEIQKLKNCAAALLIGCSSGSLFLNGSYTPSGAPLCYLLGGSPFVIGTLWSVTEDDILLFAKALFDLFLEERSNKEQPSNSMHIDRCNHRRKIGSFMCQVREACMLPFLNGASPVCYGVPTCIRKK